MRSIVFIFLLIKSFLSFCQEAITNSPKSKIIEVLGYGNTEVIPDNIFINIYINETDLKIKGSIEDAERVIVQKLIAIGIKDNDISIVDIASDIKSYWLLKSNKVLNRSYRVVAHDVSTLSKIFTALDPIGISNIQISSIEYSKIQEAKLETKIKAIKDAQNKAITLTKALNQELGKAVYIKESEVYFSSKSSNNNYGYGSAATVNIRGVGSNDYKDSLPQLEFGKIKLEFEVLVWFELK